MGPTATRRSGSNQWVEPMTRSAFTFILLTDAIGGAMAHPSRYMAESR